MTEMRPEKESLLEKLKKYGESDFYPFHMPGHKRRELPDGRMGRFPDPYSIDITEIDGFDNLHHAEGILKESMERAAEIYGADRTYYLVNGSTCGILSAICGCTDWGGRILTARNCHKSAYHGLILNRLIPEYLYPQYLEEYGINGGIFPEDVRKALERNRRSGEEKIRAVLIVSPTYEGIVSDVAAIAAIAHEYGIPLIVDEAHGAHLPFAAPGSVFPESALNKGADVVIQSLHKTLPSFTQTAVLHIKGELADREKIERYLGMFQSSSPSYLFMAAIERCILYMNQDGRKEMEQYEIRMNDFFRETEKLQVLKVLDRRVVSEPSVYDRDLSKIVISVKNAADLSGEALGDILRKKYHLEMEMCAPEYVIAMTSLMDTEEGLSRLLKALFEIDGTLEPSFPETEQEMPLSRLQKAVQKLSPAEAADRQGKRITLSESAGAVSKEFIYLYPPGIPILAPGEQITEEILAQTEWYRKTGFSVQGLSDPDLSSIITVAKE